MAKLIKKGRKIHMIFIILGVLIGFVWGLLNDDFFIGILSSILGLIVGFLLWLIVGGIIGCYLPTVEVIEEHELCALNDSTSIEGANYLFSGYIDEELVCRYVINTEKGKHIEEEKADNVYINEGDYTPKVITHRNDMKRDWYDWFAHELFVEDYYVEFFVPENTVTNEYNIDLQ